MKDTQRTAVDHATRDTPYVLPLLVEVGRSGSAVICQFPRTHTGWYNLWVVEGGLGSTEREMREPVWALGIRGFNVER